MRQWKFAALVAAVIAAPMLGTAPAAQAAPATVGGKITCKDSTFGSPYAPVGIWVQARSSTSGWAGWNTKGITGSWQARFSYSLNNGGDAQLHVGCGGTPQRWRTNIKSNYLKPGTSYNLTCYTYGSDRRCK